MLIAGRIPLQSVMRQLSEERQVFHSEGDLQHAFGRAIWKLDPRIKVRMEMRQQGGGDAREVLDMLCFTHAGSTAVEFKFYPTAGQGKDLRGEEFNLRGQGRMTCCGRGSHKTSSALKGSARNDPRATAWRFWFPTLRHCGANRATGGPARSPQGADPAGELRPAMGRLCPARRGAWAVQVPGRRGCTESAAGGLSRLARPSWF